MAITYNTAVKDIVQEAFNLMRQDFSAPDVPTPAVSVDAVQCSTLEWGKAKYALKTAAGEVFDDFDWGTPYTADGIDAWPTKMRNALVYAMARELAIPIGGRIEDMKVYASLASEKLLQAKLRVLNDRLASNTDVVLTTLLGNFKSDDSGLVKAYTVYTQRSATVKEHSDKTVKAVLDIVTLDDLAQDASNCLTVANLASSCGLDQNIVQLKMQEYQAKVAEWRKKKLNEWLATNTDPILAQLVANFKGDDTGLLNVQTVYTKRVDAVKAQSEATVKDLLGIQSLSGGAADAAVSLSVAKLAPACGIDANFVQLKMQEYNSLITECRRNKLDSDIYGSTGVFTSCADEVRKTLGLAANATLDALGTAAAQCLCYSRNGSRCGYDANFIQTKEQEYASKIHQWRKVQLDVSLSSNTDPVLTELMMNFKGDDTALMNAYGVYTQRSTNVKDVAQAEINTAHVWRTAFSHSAQSASSHPAYSAWISLCVSKLSVAMGLAADFANVLEQKYVSRLAMARAADLDAAKDAVTDADTKEVLSMILVSFCADSRLPRSLADLTDRICIQKANARRDVLLAHPWNFACVNQKTGGCQECPDEKYRFGYPYPKCLRLVSVFGAEGRLNEWRIENGMILAREPIFEIEYVRDVDAAKFPEMVRAVYLARLKALVARTVTGSAQDAAIHEDVYRRALEDAKLVDARETNAPDDVWGENHYAEDMRGGGRRFARDLFRRR